MSTATAKPRKVRYSGTLVLVDGTAISRGQTFSSETDLSTENLNELGNSGIVEVSEGLPTVSISIDTNEFGSCQNLYALAGRKVVGFDANHTGYAVIDENSFDGTSVDICVPIEQDNVLKRTMYIGDAFVSSIGWSFDVGGVATENYSLEADNKTWYMNGKREVYALFAHSFPATAPNSLIISGVSIATFGDGTAATLELVRCSADNLDLTLSDAAVSNQTISGEPVILISGSTFCTAMETALSGTSRYRAVFNVPTADANTSIPTTGFGNKFPGLSTSTIGGIRKGMIQICLISGGTLTNAFSSAEEVLRLQTCSIDVDLAREALEELGNFKAFDRSLTFPVPVTVGLSALASDMEEWMTLASKDPDNDTTTNVTQFVRDATLLVYIYDDDEGATSRNLLKKIIVEDLRVSNESFSVDQGGNATQEFTCTSDNFMVSGYVYG
jgi:hypothetical protein